MIESFYTKTVAVSRMSKDAETGFLGMNQVYASVPCAIQAVDTDMQFTGDGAFKKRFNFWCPTQFTINAGDEMSDGTNTYSVEGASTETAITGEENHVHAIINLSENA